MILLLIIFFIMTAVGVLFVNRNKEALLLSGALLSLSLLIFTVVIYISKKGGIGTEMISFFFMTRSIKEKLQYMPIPLSALGFLMVLGRSLFPLFLLKTAFKYSMSESVRKVAPLSKWLTIPIVSIIVLYSPPIFKQIINSNHLLLDMVMAITNAILWTYVLVALGLILLELFSIELKIYRKQFLLFTLFMFSISVLYYMYAMQDPAQVYQFHISNYIWQQGIYYLRSILPVRLYFVLLVVTFISTCVGILSLTKYTHNVFQANKEEALIKRKAKEVTPATSMFIHGIKNQLLSHQVVFKRLDRLLAAEELNTDEVKRYLEVMKTDTQDTLTRIENLYKSLREKKVRLVPVQVSDIIQGALYQYSQKFPEGKVRLKLRENPVLLADYDLMSEAIANLLINAQEAINEKCVPDEEIVITVYNVRAFSMIEIEDNGIGMSDKVRRKIFEPFYSNKNSKTNWGMGLHFVRGIIREHYGGIYCESTQGVGTKFTIYVPKYKG
ncbi:HAMP domain-containing histidine kinase [Aerococcaceae bacterium NML171108]|nr:HAMP domain-containing histidine kinase [Aerococcaceae bacterium NML171108]